MIGRWPKNNWVQKCGTKQKNLSNRFRGLFRSYNRVDPPKDRTENLLEPLLGNRRQTCLYVFSSLGIVLESEYEYLEHNKNGIKYKIKPSTSGDVVVVGTGF